MLRPIILDSFKNYSKQKFFADLTSGLIVGIVAIPLAVAFAIASGVTPDRGLVTAIIAGFFISLLGGSRVQIGGPTGAFVVILYGIVQNHGVEGLVTATLMAGVILIIMGFAGLGSIIKFFPYPVIVGFTSGIAVVIFTSQIRDLLGLPLDTLPPDFFGKWVLYLKSLASLSWQAFIVAAGSILILVYWPKKFKKIPSSLVALAFSIAVVNILGLNVDTIGSRFGSIPSMIPAPVLPDLQLKTMVTLISPAISIALLGAIEALLSAVVADGMNGGKHRSNIELIAQGIANVVTPIFGGIPATGAIARTATNIRNGGNTPIAGIVHAVVVLLIMIFLGRLVVYIPMAALAAILVVVAYHMSEWRTFVALWKTPRADVVVLMATFFLTVIADLTIAIQVGVALSVILFMRRLIKISGVEVISNDYDDNNLAPSTEDCVTIDKDLIANGVDLFEIKGPFFFGTAFSFEETIGEISNESKILILRMRNVPFIDSTGLITLQKFIQRCNKNRTSLILSGVEPRVMKTFAKADMDQKIGKDNIYADLAGAISRAREILHMTEKPLQKSAETAV